MKKKNTILFLIFLVGLLYIIVFQKKLVENFFYRCSYSLVKTIEFINNHISNIQDFFTSKDVYLKEIDLLKEININLLGQILHLKKINSGSDKKDYMKYKSLHYKRPALKANVLLKRISPEEHIFVIDRGSVHGVSKNLPVVFKNFLIGKVLNVYLFHSEVVLITDSRLKISILFSSSKAHGIAYGQNDKNNLAIDYIEQFETLKEDSGVYTSGEGLVFPEGFFLGELKELHKENELYANGKIKLPFDIQNIKKCFILASLETDSFNLNEPCLCSMDSLWNMENELRELVHFYKKYYNFQVQNHKKVNMQNQDLMSTADVPLSDLDSVPLSFQTKKGSYLEEEKIKKKNKIQQNNIKENLQNSVSLGENIAKIEVQDQDPETREILNQNSGAEEIALPSEDLLKQNI